MKQTIYKGLLFLLLTLIPLGATAQYRSYKSSNKKQYDGDGAGVDPHSGKYKDGKESVDRYGKPKCCETGNSNEFNFELDFSGFSNLIALENAMRTAQKAKVERWLKKQEDIFRKEINRQLGKNYSSFSEAQRAFFKIYDGGRYANKGVIARAVKLRSDNSRWASKNKQLAQKNILKHHVIDEWINCGYCHELQGLAYEQGELAHYDHDSSPSPRFYAPFVRNESQDLFKKNQYDYLLNVTRKIGLNKMIEDGFLLDHLSELRVNHYRQKGWKDRVFLMSYYLLGGCGSGVVSCTPQQLQKYAPPVFWNNGTLYEWSQKFAPIINPDIVLFTDDYRELPWTYYRNRFYPKRWQTYRNNISLTRKVVRESLDIVEKENEICGGIKWTNLQSGQSFNTNLTELRLIYFDQILGWFEKEVKLPDMCVSIPNFDRLPDGRQIKTPSHIATTRMKIAWRTAVRMLSVEEEYLKILQISNPDGATAGPLLVANLNLAFAELREGSRVSLGKCAGNIVSSKVNFCAN